MTTSADDSSPIDVSVVQLSGRVVDFTALTWGPADAPLALVLHGYPDSPRSWRLLAPVLVDAGYRVVAPFTRGYAPTGLPSDGSFHIGSLALDAIELHTLLGGDERAILIGHDWGAVAAHAVAGLERQPFRRVVTMAVPPVSAFTSPGGSIPAYLSRILRQVRLSWYMAFQQLPLVSERSLPRLVPHLWKHWSPGHRADTDVAAAWDAIADRRSAVLRYYRHAVRPWSVPAASVAAQRAVFRPSTVPMLYLHGSDDGCILADWTARASATMPPGCRAETVDGAGHFLHVEQPVRVGELVVGFVGRV